MPQSMGLGGGLERSDLCAKHKFRWLFKIPDISAEGIFALPPTKASRPNLNIKEMQVEHLNETIYYPSKVDYKPINITLYDLHRNDHPVLQWLKLLYDAETGKMTPPVVNSSDISSRNQAGFIKTAYLELYNGCGDILETWRFENVWPNQIDFGDLDMASSEIVTCDLGLRYTRAYIVKQ